MDEQKKEKITRIRTLKKRLDAPKFVANAADVVPFAWTHPLRKLPANKASKTYKALTDDRTARFGRSPHA